MRNISGYILSGVISLSALVADAKTIEVVDDIGRTVKLERPAQRIISLAPHITENLFSAGVGRLIVGTVNHSDYPAEAKAILSVGSYHNFDIELILSLQPDLVIAWKEGNQYHQVRRLEELGLTIYVNEPRSLEDIAEDISRFALLAGKGYEAKTLAQNFVDELALLRNQYSKLEKISVFYQVWNSPLMTVTNKQVIGDVIQLCGGRNVFSDLDTPTPQINKEAVLSRNPEVIIASGMTGKRPDWLDDWKQWSYLAAVAQGNLFFINPDIIQRYTARILLGARQMCETLQAARNKQAVIL